jgi:hypothetical protein
MRDSIMLHVVNSLAIEPAIRSRPNPGDADYESAKDHRGDQCLADPIALPQTKQGCAHGDYAEKLQRPFDCTCSHEGSPISAALDAAHNITL